MNPNPDLDPARQQAQLLSTHLGQLAGRLPVARTEVPSHDSGSSRLAVLLLRIRQRHQARQEGLRNARVAEFNAP